MRRLLATLLLAGAVVLVSPVPAQAKCATATLAQRVQHAQAVFSAQVTGVVRSRDLTSYAVTVETVYKGAVRARTTVTTPTGTPYELVLNTGHRYLVLGTLNGQVVSANACGGSTAMSASATAAIVALLGDGKAPVGATPPAAPAPVFTRTSTGDPAPFARLAAPGAALVIVGILGLFLLRRRAARA